MYNPSFIKSSYGVSSYKHTHILSNFRIYNIGVNIRFQGSSSRWPGLHRSGWLRQQPHPNFPPWRHLPPCLRILGIWRWRVQRPGGNRCNVWREHHRMRSREPQSPGVLRWEFNEKLCGFAVKYMRQEKYEYILLNQHNWRHSPTTPRRSLNQ